jgi:hypothetical protein
LKPLGFFSHCAGSQPDGGEQSFAEARDNVKKGASVTNDKVFFVDFLPQFAIKIARVCGFRIESQ